ncbi:hypothetical protein DPMN_056409 [Dreissena polymorpha]|uniref:Uncharacterized protein n=1 Tax=Dreissena polymorpha TaxID=45954 RepID=A0A9D4HV12_DREPO|nr:hypothetical protein DPMN_056409 [Dreissena polymorpha]
MTVAICSVVFIKCEKYFVFDSNSHGPVGLSSDGKSASQLSTYLALYVYKHIATTGEAELLRIGLNCERDNDCCETYAEDQLEDYTNDIGDVKSNDTWTVGEKNVSNCSVTKQRMSHQTEHNTLCNKESFPRICSEDN